jgi:hypothetical protein
MVDQPDGRRRRRTAVAVVAFTLHRLEKDAAADRHAVAAIEGRQS